MQSEGTEVFEFRVLPNQVPQVLTLTFKYVHPWKTSKEPKAKEKKAEFKIVILASQESSLKPAQFSQKAHDDKVRDIRDAKRY